MENMLNLNCNTKFGIKTDFYTRKSEIEGKYIT